MKPLSTRPVGELSRRLEELAVGERAILGFDRNRVRATLYARAGRMNTSWPERRFLLARVGTLRTSVTRIADIGAPAGGWGVVWEAATAAAGGAPIMPRPRVTYVPRRHGFAMWARERGLGTVEGELWAWEHERGWMAQRAAEGVLRSFGVCARTWGPYVNT